MSWADLFERAAEFDVTGEAIETARPTEREAGEWVEGEKESGETGPDTTPEDAVRVVADADVLAADLLLGGNAREALDHVRRHAWVELLASDELLEEAREVIEELATTELAEDWVQRVENERVRIEHPPGDHPGLASAYRGGARHLLTRDEDLTGAGTNLSLQQHMSVSIRPPEAFANLFDAESLYEGLFDESYPGPDCDPRE